MHRLACVNVPNLSLQLLLQKHPQWQEHPVAVISEDKPLGIIQELNKRAATFGLHSGMRYATALSLCSELRARPVSQSEQRTGIQDVHRILTSFTPEIEQCSFDAATFWLNAEGLLSLYSSLDSWSARLQETLAEACYMSRIAVGFTRFGTYAAAKKMAGHQTGDKAPEETANGTEGRAESKAEAQKPAHTSAPRVVFASPEEEREAAQNTRLSSLPFAVEHRHTLAELGIYTVEELLTLPPGGLRPRFGPEFAELYRFIAGSRSTPLQPVGAEEELEFERAYQTPVQNSHRLLRELEALLSRLLEEARDRGEQVRELRVRLQPEDEPAHEERIKPAYPATDFSLLSRLLALRLDSMRLTHGVVSLTLSAERVRAEHQQHTLFRESTTRDPDAAAQAFARIRASLGNDSIQTAVLRDSHLPEQQFDWQNVSGLTLPHAPPTGLHTSLHTPRHASGEHETPTRPANALPKQAGYDRPARTRAGLVRRILHTPQPLSHAERYTRPRLKGGHARPKGSHPRLKSARDRLRSGPFFYSGSWWEMSPVERSYYFFHTASGSILWIYYSHTEGSWMLHGMVE